MRSAGLHVCIIGVILAHVTLAHEATLAQFRATYEEQVAEIVRTSEDAEIAKAGFLDPNDPVAISFWIISIAMVAATVFFLTLRRAAPPDNDDDAAQTRRELAGPLRLARRRLERRRGPGVVSGLRDALEPE